MKPKLLVLELWGVGDLAIATPFLQAAEEKYEVTLLAKPAAAHLREFLWPEVNVIEIDAPWTRFEGKYRLWNWPWGSLGATLKTLRSETFDEALSVRPDPRDHLLMRLAKAQSRTGFPRMNSGLFLDQPLASMPDEAHRYDYWRQAGETLNIALPPMNELAEESASAEESTKQRILVHTGAAQPVRIWPLQRYRALVAKLRVAGKDLRLICDPAQAEWWRSHGETEVFVPTDLATLIKEIKAADAFIGNDSGPGHLAAILGKPTFTIFGPQRPEWFHPLHSGASWVPGVMCPCKPCFDSCKFVEPHCILTLSLDEVWPRVEAWL